MTVVKEEKLLKFTGLMILLAYFPMTFLVKDDLVKLIFYVAALLVMSILLFRKYVRDKKQNKDLTRYKMLLFSLGISVLILVFALVYPSL
jgi:heme O synthase-like polyprenyltransferase